MLYKNEHFCNVYRYIIRAVCGPNVYVTIKHQEYLFCNPILFAIYTSTFSKLCKNMYTCIQWHVEECSVALLCN
jgi:hypothetical protein